MKLHSVICGAIEVARTLLRPEQPPPSPDRLANVARQFHATGCLFGKPDARHDYLHELVQSRDWHDCVLNAVATEYEQHPASADSLCANCGSYIIAACEKSENIDLVRRAISVMRKHANRTDVMCVTCRISCEYVMNRPDCDPDLFDLAAIGYLDSSCLPNEIPDVEYVANLMLGAHRENLLWRALTCDGGERRPALQSLHADVLFAAAVAMKNQRIAIHALRAAADPRFLDSLHARTTCPDGTNLRENIAHMARCNRTLNGLYRAALLAAEIT